MLKDYQFVNWFPQWHGFYFVKLDLTQTDMAYIYEWYLFFAFWELRKWNHLIPGADEGKIVPHNDNLGDPILDQFNALNMVYEAQKARIVELTERFETAEAERDALGEHPSG